MNDEKNRNEDSEYNFITETIKEKPVNKKGIILRIAGITSGAILFGAVAALVFAGVYPWASQHLHNNDNAPRVNIDVAEPTETPEATQTPEPAATPQVLEVPRSITLEDYEDIYDEVRQVAETPLKAMVTVAGVAEDENLLDSSYVQYGQCSGVIIAREGGRVYVLTQTSALGKGVSQARITFCDGNVAEGTLTKSDSNTGLCVVMMEVKDIPKSTRNEFEVASLGNSYSLMQGKPVIAIGSPSGYNESVAYGNIISVSSKVSVVDTEYNLLVTDILGSQEGNGVLLDTGGSVIGIITQSFGEKTDTMVKGIPVAQLKSLLTVLSNGESIPYVGIYGQDVTKSISENTDIPQGIYVDSVATDSPAMTAGIQSADVIIEFGGKEVSTMQNFYTELQKCKVDEKTKIKLYRQGTDGYAEMEFDITVSEK